MNILMVNDSGCRSGGAEVHLRQVSELLRAQGHRVSTFFLSEKESGRNKNNYYFQANDHGRAEYYLRHNFFYPRLYTAMRRCLAEAGPDIIHLHNCSQYPLTILGACRGYPLVRTMHDFGPVCPTSWGVRRDDLEVCPGGVSRACVRHGCIPATTYWFDYLLAPSRTRREKRQVRTFISPSTALQEYLENHAYRNVVRVPNFVPLPDGEEGGINDGRTILYVGALREHKGVAILLRAFARVKQRVADARLWIVGGGPELAGLQRLAAELELDDITFFGPQDHGQTAGFYRQGVCTVIPSIWMENLSLVCLEAMAHGRPVIASDIGGFADLVEHGRTGFLVKRFDHRGLADKMILLLKDSRLAAELGQRARAAVQERYTGEIYLKKVLAIYAQAVK